MRAAVGRRRSSGRSTAGLQRPITWRNPGSSSKGRSPSSIKASPAAGSKQKFRYGGHGDYELSLDFGRICNLDRWTLELGAEHRFAETVNLATGAVIPVAVAPSLPLPRDKRPGADEGPLRLRSALTMSNYSSGKSMRWKRTSNAFADGNGTERFFGSAFNFYEIAVRTVPFSTLAAGVNVYPRR